MKSLPDLPNLEGLTDLAIRTGVDIRPTLLRVLTDLYVQKATHTPEDERHYTELALRLIEDVDTPTRIAVARRLADHPAAPAAIVRRLSDFSTEIAGMFARCGAELAAHARHADSLRRARTARDAIGAAGENACAADEPPNVERRVTAAGDDADPTALNELFFAAPASERRLVLSNLEFVGTENAHSPGARERIASYLLEAAALAHDDDEFVLQLGRSLHIGNDLARRIIRDASGEPLVVAAKALRMPRDVLQRILLFLNPAIGHSVERVHGLAKLYDEVTPQAADHLAAIWRRVAPSRPMEPAHRPQYWDDDVRRARSGPIGGTRRAPLASDDAASGRRGAG
jgi:hypothetical protein